MELVSTSPIPPTNTDTQNGSEHGQHHNTSRSGFTKDTPTVNGQKREGATETHHR